MAPKLPIILLGLLAAQLCAAQLSIEDVIKDVFNQNPQPGQTGTTPTPVVIQPTPTVFQPSPTQTTVLGDRANKETPRSCGFERECVSTFLCKNDTILTSGAGVIDIRFDDGNVCTYLEICCDIPNKTKEPIIDPVPPVTHVGCGYRNPDGVGHRITGDSDNESQFGEFPWMMAILREEITGSQPISMYECGGALIAPTVVITAAHCVQNREARSLFVRAGEWDTQTRNEILGHEDRPVGEIIVHERYNKGALYNDIALLVLTEPFEWQENIRPICLPEAGVNADHSRCFATGWGKDKFNRDGRYQVILKKIDLPVMPRDVCQNNLRKTRLGRFFELHESFICAGGEKDKDTCKGDGGSPLVCPLPGGKGQFYHAGIVAWGIGCGEENVPGVYASVAHLRPWINEKLVARGIDFRHFTANAVH